MSVELSLCPREGVDDHDRLGGSLAPGGAIYAAYVPGTWTRGSAVPEPLDVRLLFSTERCVQLLARPCFVGEGAPATLPAKGARPCQSAATRC